jgi:hypothetical protein
MAIAVSLGGTLSQIVDTYSKALHVAIAKGASTSSLLSTSTSFPLFPPKVRGGGLLSRRNLNRIGLAKDNTNHPLVHNLDRKIPATKPIQQTPQELDETQAPRKLPQDQPVSIHALERSRELYKVPRASGAVEGSLNGT